MFFSILFVLLAICPILVVLYLMIWRGWGGSQAGPAGWLAATLIGLIFFGGNGAILLVSFGKALLLALFVLYIIWMALFLYNLVADAGTIDTIGQELPRFATDRASQALLLAWVFGSFLQGASGFGVPAAVVAPLLVGLGFHPNVAVASALIGHAWAVVFGSLGSSFFALSAASGEPGEILATPQAIYAGIAGLLCGLLVLWTTNRWQAIRERGVMLLLISLLMGIVQYAIAAAGFWTLAAFGAGAAGLVGMLLLLILFRQEGGDPLDWRTLFNAFLPYIILTIVIVLGRTWLREPLNGIVLNYNFPQVETAQGWVTPAESGRSISLFGHAGALLLYSTLFAYAWFLWRGTLNGSQLNLGDIIWRTAKRSRKTTISIISLVAMATMMQHSGMTQLLADTLANSGRAFSLMSPFIGALGAFMTGSNTNSNVVFGSLQRETALALQMSIPYMLAAQTTGGAIGSAFAPAKVVVGVSTVEGAEDGPVLRLATIYGLLIVAFIGVINFFVV